MALHVYPQTFREIAVADPEGGGEDECEVVVKKQDKMSDLGDMFTCGLLVL